MNISAAEQRRHRAQIKELRKLAHKRGRTDGLLKALDACDDMITFLLNDCVGEAATGLDTARHIRTTIRLLLEESSD